MSLIDSTYFINEFSIAGIAGTNPTATANAARLQAVINRREPQLLKDVLGETLYGEFIAGLAEVSPIQKWVDLKAELIDDSAKLCDYTAIMYYWWLRSEERMQTAVGNTEAIHPAVNTVSLAELYNEAIDELKDLQDWVASSASDYPNFDGVVLEYLNALW